MSLSDVTESPAPAFPKMMTEEEAINLLQADQSVRNKILPLLKPGHAVVIEKLLINRVPGTTLKSIGEELGGLTKEAIRRRKCLALQRIQMLLLRDQSLKAYEGTGKNPEFLKHISVEVLLLEGLARTFVYRHCQNLFDVSKLPSDVLEGKKKTRAALLEALEPFSVPLPWVHPQGTSIDQLETLVGKPELLDKPWYTLPFGTRARKAIRRLGCNTIGDITCKSADEFLEVKNCGFTTINEIREILHKVKLNLRGD